MNVTEFGKDFCPVVVDLWPDWAQKKWTDANQAIVFQVLQGFHVDKAKDALRKQRFADPDGFKPNWGALRAALKGEGNHDKRTLAEIAHDDQAEAETRKFDIWMRGHTVATLQVLREAMLREIPRLKFAFDLIRWMIDDRFACRVLYLWERGGGRFDRYRGPIDMMPAQYNLLEQLPPRSNVNEAVRKLVRAEVMGTAEAVESVPPDDDIPF